MKNLSFQEKSIWITLVLTLLIFGAYFTYAYQAFSAAFSTPADYTKIPVLIPLFIAALILMTLITAVAHIILAIAFRREALAGEDERDNRIELKATRISYFILAAGCFVTGTSVLMELPAFFMANLLAFFFFLAEIVGSSLQLLYYRRGV